MPLEFVQDNFDYEMPADMMAMVILHAHGNKEQQAFLTPGLPFLSPSLIQANNERRGYDIYYNKDYKDKDAIKRLIKDSKKRSIFASPLPQ